MQLPLRGRADKGGRKASSDGAGTGAACCDVAAAQMCSSDVRQRCIDCCGSSSASSSTRRGCSARRLQAPTPAHSLLPLCSLRGFPHVERRDQRLLVSATGPAVACECAADQKGAHCCSRAGARCAAAFSEVWRAGEAQCCKPLQAAAHPPSLPARRRSCLLSQTSGWPAHPASQPSCLPSSRASTCLPACSSCSRCGCGGPACLPLARQPTVAAAKRAAVPTPQCKCTGRRCRWATAFRR